MRRQARCCALSPSAVAWTCASPNMTRHGRTGPSVATKDYAWDVVDLELPDAVAACRQGLLERIDATALPTARAGRPLRGISWPRHSGPVGWEASSTARSSPIDPRHFVGAMPSTLADFFDLKKFPGPRALRRSSPKFNLKWRLLADGVRPRRRLCDAFRLLKAWSAPSPSLIRSEAHWCGGLPAIRRADGGRRPRRLLDHPQRRRLRGGDAWQPAGLIWDKQLYEFEVFGIPKGDPKRVMAMDFIRFATKAENLAAVAGWVPYGPARASALSYVGRQSGSEDRHDAVPADRRASIFATAFAVDDE